MGNDISLGHLTHPDTHPDNRKESKYDPQFGFPEGRKVREMVATEAEMDSALVDGRHRDYCAHKWIKYLACHRDHKPFFGACKHYHHDYLHCLYEDELMRVKEWEREKRLDIRQRRILQKMKKEGTSPEGA